MGEVGAAGAAAPAARRPPRLARGPTVVAGRAAAGRVAAVVPRRGPSRSALRAGARRLASGAPRGVLVALLPFLVVVLAFAYVLSTRLDRPAVGAPAPTLSGAPVRGGEVDLAAMRGQPVLLSFVDTRAEDGPSRTQATFLRSMHTQHERYGLRVAIVDASGRASRDDLINYTYDFSLGDAIALLPDDDSRARRYGVGTIPTTFLIAPDGTLRQRWDGLVPVGQIDMAIRALESRGPTG